MEQNVEKKPAPLWDILEKTKSQSSGLCNASNELEKLFVSLSKVQKNLQVATPNKKNGFYNDSPYADLAEVVKTARKVLTDNGFAVFQRVIVDKDKDSILHTTLCHSSGQWIESTMLINPDRKGVHAFGAALTFFKRYAFAAITGVIVSEEDDDGNAAMSDNKKENANKIVDAITNAEYTKLVSELNEREDILERILTKYNITSLRLIPPDKYKKCLKGIEDIKNTKNSGSKNENK